jgi:hypothetical protein
MTQSENIDLWSVVDQVAKPSTYTRTANYGLAPDSTMSATRVSGSLFDTTSGSHLRLRKNPTVVNGSNCSLSFWVKSLGPNYSAQFHFQGGQVGSIVMTNEWQRVSYSAVAGTPNLFVGISLQGSIAGTTGFDFLMWGGQLEALPFASSYIRTEGAAVSRSADSLNLPVTSIPAPSKKQSMIVNFSAQSQGINDRVYEIGGTGNGRRHMFLTSTNIGYRYQNVVNFTAPLVANTPYNTVSSFDGTSVKFYVDENLIFSSTVADQTDTSTAFKIGADINGLATFYGHISKLSTYAQALTAQEITLL